MFKRISLAAVLAALLLVGAAPVASASSISLVTADPHFGGTVTFSVSVEKKYDCTGNRRCARVLVNCYQAGVLVYGEGGDLGRARGDGTSPTGYSGFLLGGASSTWIGNGGGPADCTATLFRYDYSGSVQTFVPIASTDFAAAGS